jgi:meiotic recombination protein SPO11
VNEMDDEFDHDMLFEFESPVASSGRRDAFLVDAPQLSRQTKHNDVIAQIEAVFETVADALLNERADITVSLAAHSTSRQDDPSTRGPKATFTFPGKNASDAWRFCW